MKKFFTLFAAALCVAGVQAQEEIVMFPTTTVNATDGFTPTEYVDDGYTTSTANTTLTLGVDGGANGYYDVKAQSVNLALAAFAQEVELEGEMKQRVVYVSGKNNPKDGDPGSNAGSGYNHYGSFHNIPRTGTFYVIEPAVNGTISAGVVINADKTFYVLDITETDTVEVSYVIKDERNAIDGEGNPILDENDKNVKELYEVQPYPAEYFDLAAKDKTAWRTAHPGAWMTIDPEGKGGIQVGLKVNGTVEFEAQAGHKYYLFTTGSKLGFFGYVFTPSGDDPQPAEGEDILPNFTYTWNSSETFETQADGSVIFNALQWGGLAYWLGEADWSNYEKLVVEYAEPTAALTQIKIQGCVPEMEAQAPAGSTILEAPFEGFDMTKVSQVALQAAEDGTFHISRIYLVPKATTAIDAVKTTQNENAPIYNLAGQRVSASYKGVVIQNGRKFINK